MEIAYTEKNEWVFFSEHSVFSCFLGVKIRGDDKKPNRNVVFAECDKWQPTTNYEQRITTKDQPQLAYAWMILLCSALLWFGFVLFACRLALV